MKISSKKRTVTLIILAVSLTSCLGPKEISLKPQLQKNNCYQSYSSSSHTIPEPTYSIEVDSLASKHLSCKSINVANATGILTPITEYLNLRKQYSDSMTIGQRVALVEKAQHINQLVSIASLEILSFTSEINCEEVHLAQIAEYLVGIEDKVETKLTISAIVVGGIGAVATGFTVLKGIEGNMTDYIGIATGITETTLGIMALRNSKTVEIYHEKNVLQDIWEGQHSSTLFPKSIWYYLNYHNPMCITKNESIREHIIKEWECLDQVNNTNSLKANKLNGIYFESGGKYTLEQLENRANMLSHLKAHINQMKQDLNLLAIEFARIFS